jgi:hypothetical protein
VALRSSVEAEAEEVKARYRSEGGVVISEKGSD